MRVFVRLLSIFIGLILAAAGGLLAIEVGWHWWRPSAGPLLLPLAQWHDQLNDMSWSSLTVRITAIITALLGLILLLSSALARVRTIRLTDPATEVSVAASPRSLARLVGNTVRAQENVKKASVTATAKKVRIRATSTLETENQLGPRLRESVTTLLNDLPLAKQPKVRVLVDSTRDRK